MPGRKRSSCGSSEAKTRRSRVWNNNNKNNEKKKTTEKKTKNENGCDQEVIKGRVRAVVINDDSHGPFGHRCQNQEKEKTTKKKKKKTTKKKKKKKRTYKRVFWVRFLPHHFQI